MIVTSLLHLEIHRFEKRGAGGVSEIVMPGSKEPPTRPVFDFIDPKVFAIREDLGPTMDIARDEIRHIAYHMFDKGSTPRPELGESSEIYFIENGEE